MRVLTSECLPISYFNSDSVWKEGGGPVALTFGSLPVSHIKHRNTIFVKLP